MSLAARALVSVVTSAALLTVVAMVMALLGSSSTTTGLWVSALVAFALVSVPFVRSGRSDPPPRQGGAADESFASADARAGTHDGDDELERGGDE